MSDDKRPIPKVGLYKNVDHDLYRQWDAVNASALREGRRSMQHLKAALQGQDDEGSAAKSMGTSCHAALLEHERFAAELLIGGPVNPSTGKCYGRDTKKWAEYEAEHPGRLILTAEEFSYIGGVQAAVARHKLARNLLMASGPCEAAIVWMDAETGILCKMRLDKLIPGELATDLKSSRDASPSGFARSVAAYGYHQQIAHYTDGIKAQTGEKMEIPLVALEPEPPHGVAVYLLDADAIEQGRLENRSLLTRLAECRRTGEYPGYPDEMIPLSLPKWARLAGVMATDDGGWDSDQRNPF